MVVQAELLVSGEGSAHGSLMGRHWDWWLLVLLLVLMLLLMVSAIDSWMLANATKQVRQSTGVK